MLRSVAILDTNCQLILGPSNGYAVVSRITIMYRINRACMCKAAFGDPRQLMFSVVGGAALTPETEENANSCRVSDERVEPQTLCASIIMIFSLCDSTGTTYSDWGK